MARSIIRKPLATGAASVVAKVPLNPRIARRAFMKLSAATAVLTGVAMTGRLIGKASAETGKPAPYLGSKTVRTICTYCAVGCGIEAEVHNGVWMRQEIAQDHPGILRRPLL